MFATLRPLKNIKGLPARFQNVDMVVIRELTEDLYAAIEHEIVPGVVQSIKVVTESACRRFFRFAFEWACRARRKVVHCVHKANILKMADGLFLEAFRSEAKEFPDLQTKEIIVDNCCMQMVSRPQQFDVYGDGQPLRRHRQRSGRGRGRRRQRHGRHQYRATASRCSRRFTAAAAKRSASTGPIRCRCCCRRSICWR